MKKKGTNGVYTTIWVVSAISYKEFICTNQGVRGLFASFLVLGHKC
ncbi:hypothetical protein SLEP1_g28749 [Rubroshorea leprosula]|uniref:Uncharacterized protein n=1 Tax=Rubroshorea leprosula TaxID=152421 RepID=A0AAV5JUM9_9ROSI|nr:hypothetical protein SLEP1_g28749 [Rubroshorea leprosula]